MADETGRSDLFVACERATRWVFIKIMPNKRAASARAFLEALHKACPIKITKLLTDNGREFTDRLLTTKNRQPTGRHEFDELCAALGIEHRLTKPRTPQTNGMVELEPPHQRHPEDPSLPVGGGLEGDLASLRYFIQP